MKNNIRPCFLLLHCLRNVIYIVFPLIILQPFDMYCSIRGSPDVKDVVNVKFLNFFIHSLISKWHTEHIVCVDAAREPSTKVRGCGWTGEAPSRSSWFHMRVRPRPSAICSSSPSSGYAICHPFLPPSHLQWERRDWCWEHATGVSICRDQTSGSISLTPKGLPGALSLPPSLPPLPYPPPSPFNIEAGDEKWCAFVYLPPMQMRPQQD